MTATTKTYVEVVNDAIQESGAESATFNTGGSDFNSRTDKYMNLFKTWVQRAWRDIQIECYDWEFMEEQGLCTLNPGIMMYTDGTAVSAFQTALVGTTVDIYDQDGTVAIPQVSITGVTDLTGNYTLTQPFMAVDLGGYSSSVPLNIALKPGAEYLQITKAITFADSVGGSLTGGTFTNFTNSISAYPVKATMVSSSSPTSSYTVAIDSASSTNVVVYYNDAAVLTLLADNASTTFTDPFSGKALLSWSGYTGSYSGIANAGPFSVSVVNGARAFVHSWRSYDFNEETQVGDFQEDIEEINQKTFRSIDYLHAAPTGELPIPYMPWEQFRTSYDLSSAYPGSPRLITEDNTGRYRFYPALYYPFSVKFDYNRRPQIVTNYGDTFRGITDEFADLVMWRAINYYGEYMEQPSIVARSERRYKDLLSRLEQKSREKFHFKPKKLW